MTQLELARRIAQEFTITQASADRIIKFILANIAAVLKSGKRFYFRGFGSFKKIETAPKKVRHPKTGKIITIPGKLTVKFSPSRSLISQLK